MQSEQALHALKWCRESPLLLLIACEEPSDATCHDMTLYMMRFSIGGSTSNLNNCHRPPVLSTTGQVGVVPTQETGNCSDSASTCPVRVVRGSNLQLCTELKSYPPSSIETVTVTDAIWFRGQSNRVVGCGGAAICRSFDSSYTYNGEWAACLNMTNISQSDTFTYRIYVNPSTDYPSNSPVSKTFAFAVSVEDASELPAL